MYCYRKLGSPSKPRLSYNNNLTEGNLRWRTEARAHIGHFIIKESSNDQTPHQKINKWILRLEFAEIAPPAFIPDGDTQMRFDPGAFYKSVYQFALIINKGNNPFSGNLGNYRREVSC